MPLQLGEYIISVDGTSKKVTCIVTVFPSSSMMQKLRTSTTFEANSASIVRQTEFN